MGGDLELAWIAGKSRRQQVDPIIGQGEEHDRQQPQNEEQCADHQIGQAPCFCFALLAKDLREGRDERRAQCSFGDEVAEEIGYPERHVVGVHVGPGSEEPRQEPVPDQTQYPAE